MVLSTSTAYIGLRSKPCLFPIDLTQRYVTRGILSSYRFDAGALARCNITSNMRIWESEHQFNHNWETVVSASLKKYPNPITTAIVGIDVLDRNLVGGTLKSRRLILSEWSLPSWARKIVCGPSCFATEISEVDPQKRVMTMTTKNLTMCNKLSFEEKLTYTQHPNDSNTTLLKQEAVISVYGVPLSSYLEDFLTRHISMNACKGRQAIEWVISQQKSSC